MALAGLAHDAVDRLDLVDGDGRRANIREALTGAEISRTMSGASILTLTVHDPQRALVNSALTRAGGADAARITIDEISFVLASVRKRGSQVTLEFEDAAVHTLRQRKGERSAAGGEVTRSGFVAQLLADAGLPASLTEDSGPAEVQFERADDEDSWEAIKRLADDRDWRAFSTGAGIIFASDGFLVKRSEPHQVAEHARGVGDIDFTVDVGDRADDVTVPVTATRWQIPPGDPVRVAELAPAKGDWLVAEVRRGLFSSQATVKLARPEPGKPEPEDTSERASADQTVGDAPTVAEEVRAWNAQSDEVRFARGRPTALEQRAEAQGWTLAEDLTFVRTGFYG